MGGEFEAAFMVAVSRPSFSCFITLLGTIESEEASTRQAVLFSWVTGDESLDGLEDI